MFVHVVKPGETLFSIAKRYGGTAERIRAANELEDDGLVPGCSLVIPAGRPTTLQHYRLDTAMDVQLLAKQFGVPPFVIEAANPDLSEEETRHGLNVWIPSPAAQRTAIDVNAYIVPTATSADSEILEDVRESITYLSVFSYNLQTNGGLTAPADAQLVAEAKKFRMAPLMTVTNFKENQFDPEVARSIFYNAEVRSTAVQNIVNTALQKGFSGVNIDFEHMHPGDREGYNSFIRDLAEYARPRGLTMAATVGPKMQDDPRNPWIGVFDYRTIGSLVDQVTLMTFEWGWAGGPPMAIAPLNHVRGVLEYATSVIPRDKLLMGMALYGYNWPIPFNDGQRAVGISPKAAANLAVRSNSHIHFPADSASPMFTYRGPRGEMRQVWYEDARSVLAKFHLVNEFGLRGISYWMLGHPFPQNWLLLNDSFRIAKLAQMP